MDFKREFFVGFQALGYGFSALCFRFPKIAETRKTILQQSVLLMLFLLGWASTAQADTAAQYFPHAVVGDRWTSQMTCTMSGDTSAVIPSMCSAPTTVTNTVTASSAGAITYQYSNGQTFNSTQKIDATGAWTSLATGNGLSPDAQTVLPSTFSVGTSWTASSSTQVISGVTVTHVTTGTIKAMNVTRTVPAGTFTDCIQVDHTQTGTATLGDTGSTYGVKQTYYYSPAAGMAVEDESVMTDTVGGSTFTITSTTMLQSYTYAPPIKVSTTGVDAAGLITAPVATVTAAISVNPEKVGKTGSVFVTALVPASFLGSPVAKQSAARSVHAMSAAGSNAPVLANLTQSGWQAVSNGQVVPYFTGVLTDQLASITVLNNTNTANLGGAQFCVGYGTSISDMSNSGRMKLIGTVPDPGGASASAASCLLISDARVFTYAESNYASLFAGTTTAGQYQQYDYRYYPTYKNYLAVDDLGAVWVMGPVFTPPNEPVRVGPVESFRSVITAWEANHPH